MSMKEPELISSNPILIEEIEEIAKECNGYKNNDLLNIQDFYEYYLEQHAKDCMGYFYNEFKKMLLIELANLQEIKNEENN